MRSASLWLLMLLCAHSRLEGSSALTHAKPPPADDLELSDRSGRGDLLQLVRSLLKRIILCIGPAKAALPVQIRLRSLRNLGRVRAQAHGNSSELALPNAFHLASRLKQCKTNASFTDGKIASYSSAKPSGQLSLPTRSNARSNYSASSGLLVFMLSLVFASLLVKSMDAIFRNQLNSSRLLKLGKALAAKAALITGVCRAPAGMQLSLESGRETQLTSQAEDMQSARQERPAVQSSLKQIEPRRELLHQVGR